MLGAIVELRYKYMLRKSMCFISVAALLALCGCSGGKEAPGAHQDSSPQPSPELVRVEESGVPAVKACDPSEITEETKAVSKSAAAEGEQAAAGTSISARGENPWNLTAERIQYDDAAKRARLGKLTWELYNKDGKKMLTVIGSGAEINMETQGLSFDGPVTAVGPDGEKLTANRLIWDSSLRSIVGSKGVKIERGNSTMTGDNLKASPDLKIIEVTGNVRVMFSEAPDFGSKGAENVH